MYKNMYVYNIYNKLIISIQNKCWLHRLMEMPVENVITNRSVLLPYIYFIISKYFTKVWLPVSPLYQTILTPLWVPHLFISRYLLISFWKKPLNGDKNNYWGKHISPLQEKWNWSILTFFQHQNNFEGVFLMLHMNYLAQKPAIEFCCPKNPTTHNQ